MRKQQHIQRIAEHLSRYSARPNTRVAFDAVLSLVTKSDELEGYFPELFVLGEFLFGSGAPGYENEHPWIALGTDESVWKSAIHAYRYGREEHRGLVAYAIDLRENGYTNDDHL